MQSYVQLLWQEIDPDKENVYNGAAEGMFQLLNIFFTISIKFDTISLDLYQVYLPYPEH